MTQPSIGQPGLFEDPADSAQGLRADRSPLAFAEALGLPVFLCERDGRVVAATRQALTSASAAEVLDASSGRLRAVCPMSQKLLVKALVAAAAPPAAEARPVASILFLRSAGGLTQRADVLPAPAQRGGRTLALVSIGVGPAMNEADLVAEAVGELVSMGADAANAQAQVARWLDVPPVGDVALRRRLSDPQQRSTVRRAMRRLVSEWSHDLK